jgi:glycolate oxidase iron-sulfur subunit
MVFKAFDDLDKPDMEIIRDCVHCGFCLTSCPTYLQTGNELDSPRGRIYLMRSAIEGKIPMGEAFVKHMDLCLGCLGCETACPSGVLYGRLIESVRAQIERRYKRPFLERLYRSVLFKVFPYPRRLGFLLPLLYLYQATGIRRLVHSSGILGFSKRLLHMEGMLPNVESPFLSSNLPERVEPRGRKQFKVALLTGCIQSVFFHKTNLATIRVLTRNGCEVYIPRDQVCCGALSLHSGRLGEAREFARLNIRVFEREEVDAIVVNSAGCGSAMKDYGYILREDESYYERGVRFSKKVKDISEFLAEVGLQGNLGELRLRVTYQDACHIAHAQRIKEQPRKLIRQIPGIEFVELGESDICCGSAGIYNLVEPDMSEKLLERKILNLRRIKPQVLVSGNPGCLLQIGMGIRKNGLDIKTLHLVELLDLAYRNRS